MTPVGWYNLHYFVIFRFCCLLAFCLWRHPNYKIPQTSVQKYQSSFIFFCHIPACHSRHLYKRIISTSCKSSKHTLKKTSESDEMADGRHFSPSATKTNNLSLLTCDYKTWKWYLEFESENLNKQNCGKRMIWFFFLWLPVRYLNVLNSQNVPEGNFTSNLSFYEK